MKNLLITLSVLILVGCSHEKKQPQLLLISFDGFRADYLSKTETPNFDRLIKNGATAEGLIPIFPTKTFPNHYAIASGLYPENNGLIGNNMYDPDMDARYSMGNRDAVENPNWYSGEPIWNTVEKAGKKAGTMFWIGSEAPIQNMRPSHWKSYDGSFPNEARIDTVLKWMTKDQDPVDFGTLYFSFVDSQGHRYGPDSEEVIEAIKQADELVGYLMEKLESNESINLMIVSDHGMIEVSPSRKVTLDNYIDVNKIEIISYSPALMFNVEGEGEIEIFESLKKNEENFKVYLKENIPARYHLKNNSRVPEILMVADEGYTINTKQFFESRGSDYPSGGAHGFDNANPKMDAIFVAYGPAFKKEVKLGRFENIHLYEVMAKILNIEPAPNDGDIDAVIEILK
ncbi:MAG: ectonucleotide pyrophosphatase/phosphodiesterase [Balneola sp.]|jgi:ectonucleotide pyrophosphatase/phosphodiesterase family protein 5